MHVASLNLEVGIDAAGVVKGSKDAFQALVQLTNATRHLMDGLEAMNGANGAMGKFGMLMSRASPYIMAATAAMGAISLAMNVFSGNTKEATSAAANLEKQMRSGFAEGVVGGMFGDINAAMDATSARMAAIRKGAAGIIDDGEYVTTSQIGMLSGEHPATVAGRYVDQRYTDWTPEERQGLKDILSRSPDVGGIRVGPYNAAELLGDQYRNLNFQRMRERDAAAGTADMSSWGMYPGSLTSRGPVGQPVGMGLNFPQIAAGQQFNGVFQSEQDQATVSHEAYQQRQRDTQQEQLRVMRETEQSAQQIGQYLGDAATRFITGMATARELAAALATDLLRAGLSQAATAGVRGIFNAFNAPPAQRTPGVNP